MESLRIDDLDCHEELVRYAKAANGRRIAFPSEYLSYKGSASYEPKGGLREGAGRLVFRELSSRRRSDLSTHLIEGSDQPFLVFSNGPGAAPGEQHDIRLSFRREELQDIGLNITSLTEGRVPARLLRILEQQDRLDLAGGVVGDELPVIEQRTIYCY